MLPSRFRWLAGLLPAAALLLLLFLPWLPHDERRPIELPWLDRQVPYKNWWIFFGYVGCADICPDTLARLRNAYLRLPDHVRPGVALIDATAAADATALINYVRGFHPDFQAYSPSPAELEQLSRQFGARIALRPNERGLNHSGAVYQLHRDGYDWVLIRTFQESRLGPDELAEAVTSYR